MPIIAIDPTQAVNRKKEKRTTQIKTLEKRVEQLKSTAQ